MRICKIVKTGEYAQVMELIDTPKGIAARLKYANGKREILSVTKIRMLQDERVPSSKGSMFDGF